MDRLTILNHDENGLIYIHYFKSSTLFFEAVHVREIILINNLTEQFTYLLRALNLLQLDFIFKLIPFRFLDD